MYLVEENLSSEETPNKKSLNLRDLFDILGVYGTVLLKWILILECVD
jgi:hypothetical protein